MAAGAHADEQLRLDRSIAKAEVINHLEGVDARYRLRIQPRASPISFSGGSSLLVTTSVIKPLTSWARKSYLTTSKTTTTN